MECRKVLYWYKINVAYPTQRFVEAHGGRVELKSARRATQLYHLFF